MIHSVPCFLPWSVVQKWCDVHAYNEDRSLFLDHCLLAMDNVYVKFHEEQITKKKS